MVATGFAPLRRLDRWDALIVGYALVAALFPPLTPAAAVAVLVPGLVVLALRATGPLPTRERAASRPATAIWLALAALGTGWWLVAFAWGNDADHPTLSLLLDPLLESYPARALGYTLWLAAGRRLVAR
jgi:hypothetical protein